MKQIVIICIVGLLATSCATSRKLAVSGQPGTVITTIDGETVGQIESDGTGQLEISKLVLNPFLLARTPGAAQAVPFALDYKECYGKTKFAGTMLGIGTSVGIGAMTVGLILLVAGEKSKSNNNELENSGLITMGIAGGSLLGLALPPAFALGDKSFAHGMKINKEQRTNGDLKLSLSGKPAPVNIPQKELIKKTNSPAPVSGKKAGNKSSTQNVKADKTISHASREEALDAAKKTIMESSDILEMRRNSLAAGLEAIDVYNGDKLIERHVFAE